jgi:hypothetical protein
VDDHGRVTFERRAVEDRQRRARHHRAGGEGDPRFDLAGADDRPGAGLARVGGAGVGDPFGRADGQATGAEAAVAVEVEHGLFERRRLALIGGGYIEMALEVDRGELAPRQPLRLKAPVGVEDDAVGPDQGRFGAGGERRRQGAAQQRSLDQPST